MTTPPGTPTGDWSFVSDRDGGSDLYLMSIAPEARSPETSLIDSCDARGESNPMNVASKFLRRDPAEVTPWEETCGQIRPLVEEKDGQPPRSITSRSTTPSSTTTSKPTNSITSSTVGARWFSTTRSSSCTAAVVVYVPRGTRAQSHRQADRPHRLHPTGSFERYSRIGMKKTMNQASSAFPITAR